MILIENISKEELIKTLDKKIDFDLSFLEFDNDIKSFLYDKIEGNFFKLEEFYVDIKRVFMIESYNRKIYIIREEYCSEAICTRF